MRQSRRSFLRLGITDGAGSADAAAPWAQQAPARPVPRLATTHCNGCDACAKLCPTGALTFRREETGLAYQLAAAGCTGCGDCADVCDVGAIAMAASGVDGWRVALAEHYCRRCGAAFHLPAAAELADALCRICAKKPSGLFQVR